MNIEQALAVIETEYGSDDGLLLLFRMSADTKPEKLDAFLAAIKVVTEHYTGQDMIEKDLAHKIMSFYQTLTASAGHWKVGRPEGLDIRTTSNLIIALTGVFATN